MNKLVATTLEGKFHVFDLRTQNPTKGFAQVLILLKFVYSDICPQLHTNEVWIYT